MRRFDGFFLPFFSSLPSSSPVLEVAVQAVPFFFYIKGDICPPREDSVAGVVQQLKQVKQLFPRMCKNSGKVCTQAVRLIMCKCLDI